MELKFRAWDKKTKKMREVDSIAFHNKRGAFDLDDSRTPKVINVWGRNCIEDKDIILHRESDDVILMQFTGLRDKLGCEIYEGDVVRSDNNMTVFVKWDNDDAVFCCRDTRDKFCATWTLAHFLARRAYSHRQYSR